MAANLREAWRVRAYRLIDWPNPFEPRAVAPRARALALYFDRVFTHRGKTAEAIESLAMVSDVRAVTIEHRPANGTRFRKPEGIAL